MVMLSGGRFEVTLGPTFSKDVDITSTFNDDYMTQPLAWPTLNFLTENNGNHVVLRSSYPYSISNPALALG